MNPSDFDSSLERYFDGRMSPMEEREFLSQVDGNPKLQQIISAESTMRGGIMRDRAAIPTDHGATRALLLGKLGASMIAAGGAAGHAAAGSSVGGGSVSGGSAAGSSAMGAAAAPAAGAAAGTAGVTSTGAIGTLLGGLGAKLMIAGVVAALSVGTYIGSRPSSHSAPPAPAVAPRAASSMLGDTAQARKEPLPSDSAATAAAGSPQPATTSGATASSQPRTTTTASSARRAAQTPHATEPASSSEPATAATQPASGESQKPEVVSNGKVPMRLNFDRPK